MHGRVPECSGKNAGKSPMQGFRVRKPLLHRQTTGQIFRAASL
jgi:hypothetical protein